MRNRTLVLILCLAGSLLGCSNKPNASDIATGLNRYWGTCAKISDVDKTNGVDSGNAYRVSYTYKLEVFEPKDNCSLEQAVAIAKFAISAGHSGVTKGDAYTITNETDMVKSEKGWVFQ